MDDQEDGGIDITDKLISSQFVFKALYGGTREFDSGAIVSYRGRHSDIPVNYVGNPIVEVPQYGEIKKNSLKYIERYYRLLDLVNNHIHRTALAA